LYLGERVKNVAMLEITSKLPFSLANTFRGQSFLMTTSKSTNKFSRLVTSINICKNEDLGSELPTIVYQNTVRDHFVVLQRVAILETTTG